MATYNSSFEHVQLAYELITKARISSDAGKYADAQETLSRAEKYAANHPDLMNNIKEQRQAIHETRSQFIKKLEEQLGEIFASDRFEGEKARSLLHILVKEDGGNELAAAFMQELPNKEEAERERRLVEGFRIEIEKIWQKAKEYENQGAGSLAVEEYDRAVKEALIKAGNSQNSPLLIGLRTEAQKKRNRAKEIWEGTPTLVLDKQGKELIERYERLRQENVNEAEFFNEAGEWDGRYPIDKCIKLATEMASRFADKKADEYLGQARGILDESPVAAENKIREALALSYLSNISRTSLEAELKERVIPAVQRRDDANKKIKEALSQADAEKAWLLLSEAEELDQFSPDLPEARIKLVPMLLVQFNDALSSAKREAELENFNVADEKFREISEAAKRYSNYGIEFQDLLDVAWKASDDYVLFKNKIDVLDKQLADIISLADTDPGFANEQIKQLESHDVTETERSKIERCRIQVDFRLGVEHLFNSLEDRMLTCKSEVELIPLEEMAREAISSYPTEIKFKKLAERISVRSMFLKGVRLKNDPKKRLEAKELFDKVLSKKFDDAVDAQIYIDEITISEEQEGDISIALKQAKDALDGNESRVAYLYLEPFRYSASRQSAQIKKIISIALTEWQQYIDKRLEEIAYSSEISLPYVEGLIAELIRSQSPRLNDWKERALAPALANAAKDWEYIGKFDTSMQLWEDAFLLAPKNPVVSEGRKNAKKQKRLADAQLAMDLFEKEQILNDLNNIYPDDLQVKRSLAEFYYFQSKYVEAQLVVKQANFLAKRFSAVEGNEDVTAIRTVESLLAETEIIEVRKLSIQAKTSGHVSVENYWEAKSIFSLTVSEFSHRERELNDWWGELAQGGANRLIENISNLSAQMNVTWRQIELLFKLVILDSSDKNKQELETLLILGLKQLPELISSVVENPTGKNFGGRAEALQNHIDKANTVYLDLKNISEFKRIASELGVSWPAGQVSPGEKLLILKETIANLNAVLYKRDEIRSRIQAALVTGEWEPAEEGLDEIKKLNFEDHRGIQDIWDEIEKAKELRRNADEVVSDVKSSFSGERFNDVIAGLDRLNKIDPLGITMLSFTLEVNDDLTGKILIGAQDVRTDIDEKIQAHEKISKWLGAQKDTIKRQELHDRITQYKSVGNFEKAINLCKEFVKTESENITSDFGDGIWTWGHKYIELQKWSSQKFDVNSRTAADLLQIIQQQINSINEDIIELEKLQVKLEQEQIQLNRIVSELRPLIERLKSKNIVDDLLNSRELIQVRSKAMSLIEDGQRLSPNYQVFLDLLRSNILRK